MSSKINHSDTYTLVGYTDQSKESLQIWSQPYRKSVKGTEASNCHAAAHKPERLSVERSGTPLDVCIVYTCWKTTRATSPELTFLGCLLRIHSTSKSQWPPPWLLLPALPERVSLLATLLPLTVDQSQTSWLVKSKITIIIIVVVI